MGENTGFLPVIAYPSEPSKENNLILFCSGKVRYEIEGLMKEHPEFAKRTCILVLEELLPFPYENLRQTLGKAEKNSKVSEKKKFFKFKKKNFIIFKKVRLGSRRAIKFGSLFLCGTSYR